jgi:hypothetical protein
MTTQVPLRPDGRSEQEQAGQHVEGEDGPQCVACAERRSQASGKQCAEWYPAEHQESHARADAAEHAGRAVGLLEAADDDAYGDDSRGHDG